MRRPIVWIVIVALLGGAVALGVVLTGGSGDETPAVVRTSGPLPELDGRFIQGERYSPARIHGDALVVNFWNPYCTPCRSEATILDLALGKLSRSPVAFMGVLFSNANFPHDVPAARRFARELGERYFTLDDPDGSIARAAGVRGIPTTIIADASGRMRYEILGAIKRGQVERLVRRVLRL